MFKSGSATFYKALIIRTSSKSDEFSIRTSTGSFDSLRGRYFPGGPTPPEGMDADMMFKVSTYILDETCKKKALICIKMTNLIFKQQSYHTLWSAIMNSWRPMIARNTEAMTG